MKKLVDYLKQNPGLIDNDVTNLLLRCNSVLECNDEMCENDVELRGKQKAGFDLKSILQKAEWLSNQKDLTYVPRKGVSTHHSFQARGVSLPRYEVVMVVEAKDNTVKVLLDIESIATMVAAEVREVFSLL